MNLFEYRKRSFSRISGFPPFSYLYLVRPKCRNQKQLHTDCFSRAVRDPLLLAMPSTYFASENICSRYLRRQDEKCVTWAMPGPFYTTPEQSRMTRRCSSYLSQATPPAMPDIYEVQTKRQFKTFFTICYAAMLISWISMVEIALGAYTNSPMR